jgi:hypothetical protein
MFILFIIYFLLFYFPILNCQIKTSEFTNFQDEIAEGFIFLIKKNKKKDIANKTYSQEQTSLQKAIFRKYDRKIRPVKNQSRPTTVLFHAYLMFFLIKFKKFHYK